MFVIFDKLLVCCAFTVVGCPGLLRAQFTDPRTYSNNPVGINQLSLGYVYARANASIDSSLIIAGAKLNLNVGILDYTRGVSFFHRFAWVEASVPLAGLKGAVTGTTVQGSVTGAGDSSYVFGALLKGGPALSLHEFPSYEPTTTLGVSVTITAPTGLYHANRVLNLGSDRWSFKPEIAVSHPFGRNHHWEVDGYANAYFFTDNTSYHGREILRQQSIPGLEGHLSYSFTSSVWASVDTRYSFRGDTLVDGTDQDNSQRNFTLGSEVGVSLSPQHSLLFSFAKVLLHQNSPAYTGFAIKYIHTWGRGYN
jgi:hypothetical protein